MLCLISVHVTFSVMLYWFYKCFLEINLGLVGTCQVCDVALVCKCLNEFNAVEESKRRMVLIVWCFCRCFVKLQFKVSARFSKVLTQIKVKDLHVFKLAVFLI